MILNRQLVIIKKQKLFSICFGGNSCFFSENICKIVRFAISYNRRNFGNGFIAGR